MDYPKSPVKSSPSFPENADEEDDAAIMDINNPDIELDDEGRLPDVNSVPQTITSGPTSVINDEFEDVDMDMDHNSSDKKVHWTNRDIQILLDRVEAHLEDFSLLKKHKAVWQAIGLEMEPLGFTTEHCYNKWKNLRRDVRLLVNNPSKAVRNAEVLRRVARLILIIYPNVDASTMQVNSERPSGKSTPRTPNSKKTKSDTSSVYDSPSKLRVVSPMPTLPQYRPPNPVVPITTCTVVSAKPKPIPQTTARLPGMYNTQGQITSPLSAQSTNNLSLQTPLPTNIKVQGEELNAYPPTSNGQAMSNAMLLMQSQILISDMMKQPHNVKQEEERTQSPVLNGGTGAGSGSVNSDGSQSSNVASLASSILTNLCSSGNTNSLLSTLVESLSGGHNSPCSPVPPNSNPLLVDRMQLSGELSVIVERLRDEEAVHLRLTEMVAHLAEELRAAGQRRQSALDQLISLVKTGSLPTNGNNGTCTPVSQMNNQVVVSQSSTPHSSLISSLNQQNGSGIII